MEQRNFRYVMPFRCGWLCQISGIAYKCFPTEMKAAKFAVTMLNKVKHKKQVWELKSIKLGAATASSRRVSQYHGVYWKNGAWAGYTTQKAMRSRNNKSGFKTQQEAARWVSGQKRCKTIEKLRKSKNVRLSPKGLVLRMQAWAPLYFQGFKTHDVEHSLRHASGPSKKMFLKNAGLAVCSLEAKENLFKDALLHVYRKRSVAFFKKRNRDQEDLARFYISVVEEAVKKCDGSTFSVSASNHMLNVGHHSGLVKMCERHGILFKIKSRTRVKPESTVRIGVGQIRYSFQTTTRGKRAALTKVLRLIGTEVAVKHAFRHPPRSVRQWGKSFKKLISSTKVKGRTYGVAWRMRGLQLMAMALKNVNRLRTFKSDSVHDVVKAAPDQKQWLHRIAKSFDEFNLIKLFKKIGYTGEAEYFAMHACFMASRHLDSCDHDAVRENYKKLKELQKQFRREHKQDAVPARLFQIACKQKVLKKAMLR